MLNGQDVEKETHLVVSNPNTHAFVVDCWLVVSFFLCFFLCQAVVGETNLCVMTETHVGNFKHLIEKFGT